MHVWYRLTESLDACAMDAARGLLSAEERLRHDRFKLARDQRDYAVAHSLLRTTLSRYSDIAPRAWTFRTGVHGKPELTSDIGTRAPRLTFNLAHTRGIVACAIGSGLDVGVDTGRTDLAFDCLSIAAQYLAPSETEHLARCRPEDRTARFVELWTLKEAYVKATGRGLWESMMDFGFRIDNGRIHFAAPGYTSADQWQFGLFAPEPRYRVAVAIACGRHPSRMTALSADGGVVCQPIAVSTTAGECVTSVCTA